MSNIVILRIYEKKEYLVLHGMGFYSYLAIFLSNGIVLYSVFCKYEISRQNFSVKSVELNVKETKTMVFHG